MPTSNDELSFRSCLLFLLIALLLAAPLAYHNLSDPNFWFDESGQFWMAKGLNHFSPPLSPEGSLYDALLSNRQYNLDPGGFTVLLHFWAKAGSDPGWLRALPLLFLVLTFFFLLLICQALSGSVLLSIPVAVIALLPYDMVFSYGFELRAYGMEVAGIMACLYFFVRVCRKATATNLLLLGLSAGLFMTSRYTFAIHMASLAIALFFVVFRRSVRRFLVSGYGFYLPTAFSLAVIWLFMLQYHAAMGSGPYYLAGFILKGKSWTEVLALAQTNLLATKYLPFLLFAVAVPVLRAIRPPGPGVTRDTIHGLWVWALSFQVFSILLSVLGKNPWAIHTRWSLSLQAVVILSFACLMLLAAGFFRSGSGVRPEYRWLKAAAVAIVVAMAMTGLNKQVHYSYDYTGRYLSSLHEQLDSSRFFVGYYSSSTVRYLFEYGPLRQRTDMYPQHFSFETRGDYFSRSTIACSQVDYAVLSLVDETGIRRYQDRFDRRFAVIAGQPISYLLQKEEGP